MKLQKNVTNRKKYSPTLNSISNEKLLKGLELHSQNKFKFNLKIKFIKIKK